MLIGASLSLTSYVITLSLNIVGKTAGAYVLLLKIVPLLLTVDWILSRGRAMTNVTSDILVAVLLDHFQAGKRETPQDHEDLGALERANLNDPDGI